MDKELTIHVNPKDFGAKCDGVTDDGDAVERAIDWAAKQLPMGDHGQRLGSIVVEAT